MRKDAFKSLGDHMKETPGGLLVTEQSYEALVKAEAQKEVRKILTSEEEKRGSLFSRNLAHNMGQYGAREKPQGTPNFRTLYAAAKHSFVDAILIRTRIDQMKRIWQRTFTDDKIGFRVVHERHEDDSYKVTKGDDTRCREMEDLLIDPSPERFTQYYPHRVRPHTRMKDLASVLAKAELVIDRKVIRRIRRADGQGYAAFHWLPGETILNADEAMRDWAAKNEVNKRVTSYTAMKMSEHSGIDITESAYVQVIDGMLVESFKADEISIHISNPSDEINQFGYGTSRLELSLEVTAVLMHAWNFNKEMFNTNYPESILSISGDFDKEGLQAFKQQMLGETHGSGNYWRLPIIPSSGKDDFKIEAHKLRDTPKDMLFDQFIRLLLMFKSAAYGSHPSQLNLAIDSGGGSGSLFGSSQAEEIELSKEQGLIPMLDDMCEWLTDAVVKPRYSDLKVIIVGMEKEDKKAAVDIRSTRGSKWLTKNECRLEEGRSPIGFWVEPEQIKNLSEADKKLYDTNPWNYPSDVPIANYINTFQMADQGEEDPGGQDDDGQDDDGQDDDGQDDAPPNDEEADNYYQGKPPGADIAKARTERTERFLEITFGDEK
jgi:hypothetical protein